jgi:sporulation protein YlmC with PRC-barrel domain
MQTIRSDDLEGMQVVNARGEQMGEVENLVMSTTDNKQYVVSRMAASGSRREAGRLVAGRLMMQGDRVVVPGLTDEQIQALAGVPGERAGVPGRRGRRPGPDHVGSAVSATD